MEGDTIAVTLSDGNGISIHALRVEGDYSYLGPKGAGVGISIHALRVEGDLLSLQSRLNVLISIHALRVEGDVQIVVGVAVDLISIHALRVEGDRFGFQLLRT